MAKKKNVNKQSKQAAKRAEKQKADKRLNMIAIGLCVVAVIAFFAVTIIFGGKDGGDSSLHHVEIEFEDYGTVALELDASKAPITVENFINLAESGFYDGITIHRVMPGFVIQGGDPYGTGLGGSSQTIKGEFSVNGVENDISHVRGVISMARSDRSYDSASSQFFIVLEDSTFLDGQYAGFGWVTEGMDVVDAIAADAVIIDTDAGIVEESSRAVIKTVKVID